MAKHRKTFFLFILLFQIFCFPKTSEASITGTPYGGSGDWTIADSSASATYTNETFTVYGNITINSTGALNLVGTTIYVEGNILVNTGGSFSATSNSTVYIKGTPANDVNPNFRTGGGRGITNQGGMITFTDSTFNSNGTYNRETIAASGCNRSGIYGNNFNNSKGDLLINNATFYNAYFVTLSSAAGPHTSIHVTNSSFYGDYLVVSTSYYASAHVLSNLNVHGTLGLYTRIGGLDAVNINADKLLVFGAIVTLRNSTIGEYESGDGSHDLGRLVLYNSTVANIPKFVNASGYLYHHKNLNVQVKDAGGSARSGVNVKIYDENNSLVSDTNSDASGNVVYDFIDNYSSDASSNVTHTPSGPYTVTIEGKSLAVDLRYADKELNIVYQGSNFNVTPGIMISRALSL